MSLRRVSSVHLATVNQVELESRSDCLRNLQQEARMVFPGVQALFGFQLIAVFNAGFRSELSSRLQVLHLAALLCSAIATLLIIFPAAHHRQAESGQISNYLLQLGNRCLCLGMLALSIALTLDIYLISRMILGRPGLSFSISGFLLLAFLSAWFLLPEMRRRKNERV